MSRIFIRSLFALLACAIASSCSLYRNYKDSRPANVMETEARLARAGFRRVPIETPEQDGAVAQLPMHKLNRYDSAKGSVFWYLDPDVCHCLYEGDESTYQQYVGILEQEQQTAEYVNDVRPEQVAYLSPFGYAFPTPLLLGGWPILYPGDGGYYYRPPPIIGSHPGGGGGSRSGGGPIHPHPGGGGGGGFIHGGGGGRGRR